MQNMDQKPISNPSWEVVQLCRHPQRPHAPDYIEALFTNFLELHGDRNFSDDHAIVGGLATFENQSVLVVGHRKGRLTRDKIKANFGMPKPEGYRKAIRLMSMAERFSLPIITFIDTPGAYPGVDAEERGQAEAIAKNIMIMSALKTPIISVVIGEGGSGGALAIGVADRILMLENSTYSVISPESCAAILWRDATQAPLAAQNLKLSAKELLKLGIIDEIVPEPTGGAHTHPKNMFETLKKKLSEHLKALQLFQGDLLLSERYNKYRNIGAFED